MWIHIPMPMVQWSNGPMVQSPDQVWIVNSPQYWIWCCRAQARGRAWWIYTSQGTMVLIGKSSPFSIIYPETMNDNDNRSRNKRNRDFLSGWIRRIWMIWNDVTIRWWLGRLNDGLTWGFVQDSGWSQFSQILLREVFLDVQQTSCSWES